MRRFDGLRVQTREDDPWYVVLGWHVLAVVLWVAPALLLLNLLAVLFGWDLFGWSYS